MESETSIWKWTLAVLGVIVVCFLIGFFVLGPSARPRVETASITPAETVVGNASQTVRPRPSLPPGPAVDVEDRTAEVERKRQEEARRKAEAAEKERQRRAEADAERERLAAEKAAQEEIPPADESGDTSTSTDDNPATPDGTTNPDGSGNVAAPSGSSPSVPTPGTGRTPAPGVSSTGANPAAGATLYRIRVGTFEDRENAQSLAVELNGRGYATHMEPAQMNGETVYHVQVGAYRDEKRAREIQKELKANGYDSTLATSPRL